MRSIIYSIVIAAGATAALAQSPPATTTPGNNAVNSSGVNNSSAPVAGANSFTEAQAKSRIEANGYSTVSGLMKDDKGIWRGKASKDGKSVDVTVDFQGNINAR
jgi:zona occludens toxin (predicted ATPase)